MIQSGQNHRGVVYYHQERYIIGDQIRRPKELTEAMTIGEAMNRIISL